QFLTSDHFAAVLKKNGENLAGLLLELYAHPVLAQFTGPKVELVRTKAQRVHLKSRAFHGLVRRDDCQYNPIASEGKTSRGLRTSLIGLCSTSKHVMNKGFRSE